MRPLRKKGMNHVRLSELKGKKIRGVPVFPGVEKNTAWRQFDCVELEPGAQLWSPLPPDQEVGYLVLDGTVECAGDELAVEVEGPAALLCGVGWPHTLANSGDSPACLLRLGAALEAKDPAPRALLIEQLEERKLKWRPAIHGGIGRIATRHVWGPDDFQSPWTFLDHAVLAPRSSVGYHYHQALEECFVILRGAGRMVIDGETFAVGPGSVTWQGIRQAHGIYNPNPEDLDFLRVAVGLRDEKFTTVDLNDDLSDRKPIISSR